MQRSLFDKIAPQAISIMSFLNDLCSRKKISRYNNTDILPNIISRNKSVTSIPISHVSAFNYGNAGDILLPVALRDIWQFRQPNITWVNQPVYPVVDNAIIEKINKSKGLVIGGGGLFLKDTNPNRNSGWQWPCSIEMLDKIKVPLVLYAVGYNRFRGQDDFEPVFTENISAFAEKAVYLGIRNYGSINALKNYLPIELHHKLVFQPCMTTVLSKLYPDVTDYETKENFIALNCAFDRSHLRFGEKIGELLTSIGQVVKELSKNIPVKFYSHMQSDQAILPFLEAFGVKYEVIDLQNIHPRRIIEEYAKPKLVIGMRGHAQMIPFGCKTPIISIVSHNKMQWFLDDIQRPEWGADISSDNFREELIQQSLSILENIQSAMGYIEEKQDTFFQISLRNINNALKIMINS